MIEAGKCLAGGDDPRLRWICGRAEDALLDPPYSLATAGSSLHWMDWDVILLRLAGVLTERGALAIFNDECLQNPWDKDMAHLIPQYSTNQDFEPYDLIEQLVQRQLFEPLGSATTQPIAWQQSIENYIESVHLRNGFSRNRMTPPSAAGFDHALWELIRPHGVERMLTLYPVTRIAWGRPLRRP